MKFSRDHDLFKSSSLPSYHTTLPLKLSKDPFYASNPALTTSFYFYKEMQRIVEMLKANKGKTKRLQNDDTIIDARKLLYFFTIHFYQFSVN